MITIVSSPLRLYRRVVIDSLRIVRHYGLRELLRQRGWKFVAAIATYYLVRDTLVYVIIPLCIARGIH